MDRGANSILEDISNSFFDPLHDDVVVPEKTSINYVRIKPDRIKPDRIKPDRIKPDRIKPDRIKPEIQIANL